MTKEDKMLYKTIDTFLWKEWDPIGVNKFPEARDEYQSYLPEVFRLKTSGANEESIAQYLLKVEIERMGLSGNLENCKRVAHKVAIL